MLVGFIDGVYSFVCLGKQTLHVDCFNRKMDSLLRYILYFLLFIYQVERAYCEQFDCFYDICDTIVQYCNKQEKRCNYCSPQQCRLILEKDVHHCEEFCKNLTATTTSTTTAAATTSQNTPQYYNNGAPQWWYIFIGVVVVAILVVSIINLIINVRNKYKKNPFDKERRADGKAAELKVLIESKDSGFENQNGREQPEIIELKDLSPNVAAPNGVQPNGVQSNCVQANGVQSNGVQSNGVQANGVQQPIGVQSPHHDHYDHDQSKMLAGHDNTSVFVNPPQQINRIQQPYTYPGEDKSRHERMDPNGLSLHNHGRKLGYVPVPQTSERDQTNLKYC
ncbi:uncharacterized protein LOC126810125 [Patella vulgata]|uniref:uncharacterized protein LOC126810125 n=1 Tax=Patella vulgata TaxID=6465 RepID=UPI0021801371|nr:uncharacterized protein LOC126810125 [Patella vulgata]